MNNHNMEAGFCQDEQSDILVPELVPQPKTGYNLEQRQLPALAEVAPAGGGMVRVGGLEGHMAGNYEQGRNG